MSNAKVIVFIESQISKTFLFECSRFWASEGHRVHFIAKHDQEKLPPTVQGIRSDNSDENSYAEFLKISFVTAPTTKDFMDYLVSLRQSPHLPKVLIVENITNFEQDASESEFLLLCSFLKHTANFCARAHNDEGCLIISSEYHTEKLNTMNFILLPEKIWRSHEEKKSGENDSITHYILRELSLNPLSNDYEEMSFSLLQKHDGKYVRLNRISRLFDESNCNFNNVIS